MIWRIFMKNTSWVKICSILAPCCFLFAVFPTPTVGQTAEEELEDNAVMYIIENIQGSQVKVKEAGSAQWESAQEGQGLVSGDEVKVGDNNETVLELQDHTCVFLRAGSYLKVGKIEANENKGFISRLVLLTGSLLSDVKKNLEQSHSTFEIESNGVICGVRGTAFEVTAQGDSVQNITYEGKVEVVGGGKSHLVTAGNLFGFRAGKFLLQRSLNRVDNMKFEKWRALRKLVLRKRLQRIEAIKQHKLKPWKRKHPHPALQKENLKRKLMMMKRNRQK
jgi:hypothetical protein